MTNTWILPFFLLFLSGCATMGKDECLNAQWQSIGYEDGARGYVASRIAEHRKACAKHNVVPDLDSYNLGRGQGLLQWCTSGNGYYQGTRGMEYNGVCAGALEHDFLEALNKGLEIYTYHQEIRKLEEERIRLHHGHDEVVERIARIEDEIVSDYVGPRRRRILLDEMRSAERERESILSDISEIERLLVDAKSRLEIFQVENSRQY
jgi:hypothetical protein